VKTIAVDFDGVIHKYSGGWRDGTIYDEPMAGAIEGIKQLQKEYAVFVFTTRDAMDVAEWLESHGIEAAADHRTNVDMFWNDQKVVLVTNRKLAAVAYLDDRAIRFKDWNLVYYQLKEAGV
jgi:FMN phosphatase YigB (HAD superfamily)